MLKPDILNQSIVLQEALNSYDLSIDIAIRLTRRQAKEIADYLDAGFFASELLLKDWTLMGFPVVIIEDQAALSKDFADKGNRVIDGMILEAAASKPTTPGP